MHLRYTDMLDNSADITLCSWNCDVIIIGSSHWLCFGELSRTVPVPFDYTHPISLEQTTDRPNAQRRNAVNKTDKNQL